MELNDFIGKVVINVHTKRRFILHRITSPEIMVYAEDDAKNGRFSCYCWRTINGDPFTNGDLIFEDESLNEPFKTAFDAYNRTRDAYWEEYGYWMRRD